MVLFRSKALPAFHVVLPVSPFTTGLAGYTCSQYFARLEQGVMQEVRIMFSTTRNDFGIVGLFLLFLLSASRNVLPQCRSL
jgi:hypothetical protein